MKQFIKNNCYKFMTTSAMLIFSLSCIIFAATNNSAKAGAKAVKQTDQQNTWIVANDKGIFEVIWNNNSYPQYKCVMIFNANGK